MKITLAALIAMQCLNEYKAMMNAALNGGISADNCFGDYFTRKGLTSKERELLIFTMLTSMGGAEAQLKSHIRNNQRIGNDKQQLIETITVLLPFIGYPRTLTALNCMNEVLQEEK